MKNILTEVSGVGPKKLSHPPPPRGPAGDNAILCPRGCFNNLWWCFHMAAVASVPRHWAQAVAEQQFKDVGEAYAVLTSHAVAPDTCWGGGRWWWSPFSPFYFLAEALPSTCRLCRRMSCVKYGRLSSQCHCCDLCLFFVVHASSNHICTCMSSFADFLFFVY